MMQAARLRIVDEQYKIHLGAWLTFAAQARKSGKSGKPVYSSFDKFFDYKKELAKITNETKSRFDGIGKLL